MKRLLAIAIVALATAAPAYGYYSDDGGGNRPDCTAGNVGWGFGHWVCTHDPFAGGYEWYWPVD